MNKQSMWFLTLFSLVLVLSVYYITMPNELLLTANSNYTETSEVSSEEEPVVALEESEAVIAYNEELETSRKAEIASLESVMLDTTKSTEEKNEAYEQIGYLNELTGKEEKLERKIMDNLKIDAYVEIDNSSIKVVAAKSEHDTVLANKIIKLIQEEFNNSMYITVKFET